MNLLAFFFFALGILGELAWLWDKANPQKLNLPFAVFDAFIGITVLVSIGVSSLVRHLNLDFMIVSMSDPLVAIFFVVLGLFILYVAIFAPSFLPRVNEQSILLIQLIIPVTLYLSGKVNNLPAILAFWGVPFLVMGYLAVRQNPVPPILKVLVYFWYLVSLMIQGFTSESLAFFRKADLTPSDAFTFGIFFVFLILHGLITLRFFLIVSSLLRPRNHVFAKEAIQSIFYDEQIPLLPFLGLLAIVFAGMYFLQAYHISTSETWINLGIVVIAQVIFSPAVTRLFHAQPEPPTTIEKGL